MPSTVYCERIITLSQAMLCIYLINFEAFAMRIFWLHIENLDKGFIYHWSFKAIGGVRGKKNVKLIL